MKPGDIVYSAKPEYGENLLVVVTEGPTYNPDHLTATFCGVAIKGPLAPNYRSNVYCSHYHVLDRARYNTVLREFNYVGNSDSLTDFDSSRRINPGDVVTLPYETSGSKSFIVVTSVRYNIYAAKREGHWVLNGFLFGCAEGPRFVYGKYCDNYAVIPIGTDAYKGVSSRLNTCSNSNEVPCVNTHTVKFTTEDKLQALTQRVIQLEKLTQLQEKPTVELHSLVKWPKYLRVVNTSAEHVFKYFKMHPSLPDTALYWYGNHYEAFDIVYDDTDNCLKLISNGSIIDHLDGKILRESTRDAYESSRKSKPHSEDPLGPTPTDLQAEVARLNALLCDYREELCKRRRNAKRLREYVSDARTSTKELGDTSCITMESLRQFWNLIKECTADDAEDSKEKCDNSTSYKSNTPEPRLGPTVVKLQHQVSALTKELESTQSILMRCIKNLEDIRKVRDNVCGKSTDIFGVDYYDGPSVRELLETIRQKTEVPDV